MLEVLLLFSDLSFEVLCEHKQGQLENLSTFHSRVLEEQKGIGCLLNGRRVDFCYCLDSWQLQSHDCKRNLLEWRDYCQNHITHELEVIGRDSRCILALRRRLDTSHDTLIYGPNRTTVS